MIPTIKQDIIILTDNKIDNFTDSMIEDIQDIIRVEYCDEVKNFTQGILPPRYKELKEEMKVIIHNYIIQNLILEGQTDDFVVGEYVE